MIIIFHLNEEFRIEIWFEYFKTVWPETGINILT